MFKKLLFKSIFILVLTIANYSVSQAQFATTGVGRYKEQIFWLNWNKSTQSTGLTSWPANYGSPVGRLDGAQLVLGEYVWTILPEKIRVVGTISNLSDSPITSANINASPRNGGTGDYSTGFLNMYGGVEGSIGIKNGVNGALVQITLSLSLQIFDGANWVAVTSPGIVVADAESLTVTNAETIQATAQSDSDVWELLDYNTGTLTSSTSTYRIDITSSGNAKTFKAYNTTASGSTGDRQESVVMFARGVQTLDMQMKGNGLQIAAFGFVMPFDYGDLPQSYSEAAHYLPLFDHNGQSTALPVGTHNPKTTTIETYTSRAPVKLGANADADYGFNFTQNADGDDLTGIDDEDGISDETLNNITLKTTSLDVTASNSSNRTAYILAWIDHKQSGVFDYTDELVITNNAVPAGSQDVVRTLSLPNDLKAGQYYALRVRIGSGTTHQDNSLAALDGEVEDYRIYIKGYSISGTLLHDVDGLKNGLSTVGIGRPDDTAMYAYLLDADGKVVARATIDATTGAYTFADVNWGNYQVKVTNNDVITIGDTPNEEDFTLPQGWNHSIQKDADGTLHTRGTATVSVREEDALEVVKVVAQGINKKPVTDDASYTLVENPTSGQVIPLNNTVQAREGGNIESPSFEDTDDESNPLTLTIETSPTTNGDNSPANTPELVYNNQVLVAGQVIENFDPELLEVRVKGSGYTNVSFTFKVTDAAGATSNVSTYTLQWDSALPVTLVSFKAASAENQVVLNWSTVEEQNSSYFEIERLNSNRWISLGKVTANSNTTSLSNYDFIDGSPSAGENIYRLKMVDLDGTFTHSSMVSVIAEAVTNIYPNPAHNFLNVRVAKWEDVRSITIVNTAGVTMYSGNNTNQLNTNAINIEHLPGGLYFLKIENTNGSLLIRKFSVVR